MKEDEYGLKPYSAYIFDLYGTLVDIHTDENQPSLWKQMAGFYAARGAQYAPRELQQKYNDYVREAEEALLRRDREPENVWVEIEVGRVFARLYEEKGIRTDGERIAQTALQFRRASLTHLRLYAGAKELLSSLRQRGRGVYLLSNAQRLFTAPELEALGLADCFDGICISSDEGFKKPDPRFFRCLLERFALEPGTCLMIGNDPICDGQGAKKVGIDSWCIRSGISPRELTEGYDQQGMDLRRLLRYLR